MTSSTEEHEMSDLPLPEIVHEQNGRLGEMINRRADPASFPTDLPAQPPSRDYKRWLLPGILLALLLASMGATAGLGIFLGKEKSIGTIAETKTASGLSVRGAQTQTATLVSSVESEMPVATITTGTLTDSSEVESQSWIDAVPLTSGAAPTWRKWWIRCGVKHGLRKIWKQYKRSD